MLPDLFGSSSYITTWTKSHGTFNLWSCRTLWLCLLCFLIVSLARQVPYSLLFSLPPQTHCYHCRICRNDEDVYQVLEYSTHTGQNLFKKSNISSRCSPWFTYLDISCLRKTSFQESFRKYAAIFINQMSSSQSPALPLEDCFSNAWRYFFSMAVLGHEDINFNLITK